jgi:poly(3-hydroxyalkanoate) synthetase
MHENISDRREPALAPVTNFPAANFFVWPFIAAAAAGDALAAQAGQMARLLSRSETDALQSPRLDWCAASHVRLELSTMDLRDFSSPGTTEGVPTLICAPFALHGATIADLAPGHSLIEALTRNGCRRILLTDWRSATADMRLLTIDSYLAELNVAIDEIGGPVDLVGLCQGGWMALVYAARFPAKVRKLVLVGAPVDTDACTSRLSNAAHFLPFGVFDELTRLGDGRVLGRRAVELWEPALQSEEVAASLQLEPGELGRQTALRERFRIWSDSTLDLPGAFYRQTVLWLFKENRLAGGRFTALGRQVDLGEVRHPLFLVAARDDQVAPPQQLLAVRHLVGTRPHDIESVTEPGNHLSLFVGAETLRGAWPRVARWLNEPAATAMAA